MKTEHGIDELAATGEIAASQGNRSGSTSPRFHRLNELRRITEYRFCRWIVDNLIGPGLCIIYGRSSVGKSFLTVGLSAAIATGGYWAGRRCLAGSVLVIASEDFFGMAQRFVAAIDRLCLVPEAPIVLAHPPHFLGDAFAAWLRDSIRDLERTTGSPVRAIIIDTLGAAFGYASQDESSAMTAALEPIARVAAEYNLAAIVLHHTRKDGHDFRGSQVIEDRADSLLRLERKGSKGVLIVEKQRNGVADQRIPFVFEVVGAENESTCRIRFVPETNELPLRDNEISHADRALVCLKKLLPSCPHVTVERWKLEFFKETYPGQAKPPAKGRQAFHAARKQLLSMGIIQVLSIDGMEVVRATNPPVTGPDVQ